MKFVDLIKPNNWLSIELIFLNLYPDQEESIEDYREVFEKLTTITAVDTEMIIVLATVEDDFDPEEPISYVDVSGRKPNGGEHPDETNYAIEFEEWEKWLGMDLAPETLQNFNELEIIAHCLFEMTFCGFDEVEIQEQFEDIKKTKDELKSLSKEQFMKQTISLEDLMKKYDNQEDDFEDDDENETDDGSDLICN